MAKRTRAPARRARNPARKTKPRSGRKSLVTRTLKAVQARRVAFTTELLDHARRRYERRSATNAQIGLDLGVHKATVCVIARREGWRRDPQPPRDLPPAVRLANESERLEQERVGPGLENTKSGLLPPNQEIANEPPPLTVTVKRLYQAVLEELAAVESLRARLGREPQSAADAERTARTLASLTETLQKLQRLQCATSISGYNDDDMPADIDEFREALARRIEQFVASRMHTGNPERPAAST